jgi:hypothetical protein
MKQLILVAFLVSVSAVFGALQPKWTDQNLWRHGLKLGMTEPEVTRLLGKPLDEEVSRIAKILYYQRPTTRINGDVTERPTYATIKLRVVRTKFHQS